MGLEERRGKEASGCQPDQQSAFFCRICSGENVSWTTVILGTYGMANDS